MKQLIIFFVIFLSVFVSRTYAQESIQSATESAADKGLTTDIASDQIDDYPLPYPGLLPDNPLYIIKTFRDKIVSILISNPEKKAEFDLLQADKRLQAGVFLIQKSNKYDLAEQTISKGQNYLEESLMKENEAKKQGMDIGALQDKLKKATKKHRDIISDLTKKTTGKNKTAFMVLLARAEKLEKDANALNIKN
jgi:hypothetical protein